VFLSKAQSSARQSKVMSLSEAISEFIFDGASVSLEGFTHAIPTAAGHEIIRQGFKDLTLYRQTADIIVDQMLAAGCISTLVSSFVGNSSAGSLGEIRRRIEQSDPVHLNYVEYSHYGMVCRYLAGAQKLPFYPLKSYFGSDLPEVNDEIRKVSSPYPNEDGTFDEIYVVPPINPDVTIVHAQRADQWGNIQMWGLTGLQAEAVFSAEKAIVTVEEIVPDDVVRSDPNRTIIPSHAVSAVVQVPMGAHPSFTQGYYDRDNNFYRDWSAISGDKEQIAEWMTKFIYETKNHEEYVELLGAETVASLAVGDAFSTPINYGSRI
jgi:glutaconate CoA-transferase subunit A